MDVFFESADNTQILGAGGTIERSILAHWNYEQDPLFSERASSVTITLLIQSADALGLAEGQEVRRQTEETRYKVIELSETCGDGKLTTLRVTRVKV